MYSNFETSSLFIFSVGKTHTFNEKIHRFLTKTISEITEPRRKVGTHGINHHPVLPKWIQSIYWGIDISEVLFQVSIIHNRCGKRRVKSMTSLPCHVLTTLPTCRLLSLPSHCWLTLSFSTIPQYLRENSCQGGQEAAIQGYTNALMLAR